jgi:CheY-like chemotaxis protein
MRVLVVDDDKPIRVLMSRILRRSGFVVEEAVDGQDAIEKLAAGDFDAMVLDLMMPRVDGFGVLSYLTEHAPRMVPKTVVATAFSRSDVRERFQRICNVISKPFEISLLTDSVHACTAN